MNERKIALVTGGNRGIGYATAKELGLHGVKVYLGARDADRGEKAAMSLSSLKIDAMAVRLDVSDDNSIAEAYEKIKSGEGRLDILINNAGITVGPDAQITPEGLRQVYETNVFGLYAVTRKFLPLLEAGRPSRILNISSGLGSLAGLTEPSAGGDSRYGYLAYGSSKTTVNAISAYLGHELKAKGITVLSIAPGFTATEFNNYRGIWPPEHAAGIIVRYALDTDEKKTGGFFDENGRVPW